MALGWLLAAGFLQAEAPMDLNSPFQKVALVKAKTGEVETRDIQKARLVGGSVEMERVDGGMAIFPIQDVVAILPRLPPGDEVGTAEQAEEAIRLLQGVAPDLLRQAGLERTPIQDWEKLKERLLKLRNEKEEQERKQKETKEAQAKSALAQEVQAWRAQVEDLLTPRTEKELMDLKQSGLSLARENPGDREVILDALAMLSQVQPKEKGEPLPELRKLNEVQPRLVPDDLLGWLAGGVLILSFFGLLFGLAFLSSSQTRFQEGAYLGGILFGLLGLGLLGLLVWTWLPAAVSGQNIQARLDPKMEELGRYLKNRAKPVYYFSGKRFSFSPEEWTSGIQGYLAPADESVGLFKAKMRGGELWLQEDTWIWRQPLTALGVPLPVSLTLEGSNPELRDWETPTITKVYLGRWQLPDGVARLLIDSASSIWRQGLFSGGLAGVKLTKDDQGMILIDVPAAGGRPKGEVMNSLEQGRFGMSEWEKILLDREEITAEELAKAVASLKKEEIGAFYEKIKNRFYRISGEVEAVGGHNFTDIGKMGPDSTDDIFLMGIKDYYRPPNPTDREENTNQHLLIRCVIKTDWVFEMDARKDLYARQAFQEFEQSPKKGTRDKPEFYWKTLSGKTVTSPRIDPAKEKPLISRGKKLLFKQPLRIELELYRKTWGGRKKGGPIEAVPFSDKAGDLELYGIALEPNGHIHEIIEEVALEYHPIHNPKK